MHLALWKAFQIRAMALEGRDGSGQRETGWKLDILYLTPYDSQVWKRDLESIPLILKLFIIYIQKSASLSSMNFLKQKTSLNHRKEHQQHPISLTQLSSSPCSLPFINYILNYVFLVSH